jgi:hypothetical protein
MQTVILSQEEHKLSDYFFECFQFSVSCISHSYNSFLLDCFSGEAFYPSVNTLGVEDHKDTEDAVDRMVDDLEKQ